MNRRYIPTWTARAAVVLIVLALLLSPSPALAAKDRSAPTTPTNLHTTAITATSVTLAWNPSRDNSGSVRYRIQMVSTSLAMETSQTSLTWTSLSTNTSYSFYVFAIDRSGNRSANSNTLTVTTLADTTPPTSPELSGSVLGPSQVSLTWTAATDENQWFSLAYDVWVNGSPAAHVNWYSQRSVRIRHLTPATTYTFTVQAWDTSGNRSTSNAVTLTTEPSSDTVPPTAPTNLHLVSDQGGGEFYVGWTQSTDDVDPQHLIEYEIYVNGVLSPLAVSAGVDQDFVYARPECVNTLVVKAVDRTGNTSEPSNELTLFPWGQCP